MTKRFAMFNLLALMCFPIAARASLITGTVNFSGTIELGLGSIAFIDNAFTINSPASTQVGEFMALESTTGTIQNIVNPPDATGSLDVPDFMTFSAVPNITFELTFLQPGIDGAAGCTSTPAAGQVCTPDVPAQSPLNFQNTTSATSTISFVLQGLEFDSLTATTIPVSGIFTMQVSNMNFQQVLGEVQGGETVPLGFSASFSTGSIPSPSVPEPNTWTAIVIGAAAMGLRYRRKLR